MSIATALITPRARQARIHQTRVCQTLGAALCWLLLSLSATAQETPPAQTPAPAATEAQPAPSGEVAVEVETQTESAATGSAHGIEHDVILRLGKDSELGADGVANSVVSIVGSSTTAGHVRETVVSIFGNTHVTGPVGDAAVAIFGNVYVDSPVGGDVVAIFGDVELGPQARVGGQVVMVSGELTRDPAATVAGAVQQVTLPVDFGRFEWLRPWVKHCLLLARPLAFEPGLGWAWTLALGFLALYVVLALMFTDSVERCIHTIETRPGRTLVASLLTLLLAPILTVVLAITIVGGVLVPFVWLGIFFAGLFGKTVILATLGRRLTRPLGEAALFKEIAIAVLIGGLIMLLLYTVPVIGFIAFKVLGILGVGVVVYTLLLAAQAKREAALAARPAPAVAAAVATAATPAAADADPAVAAATAPPEAATAAAPIAEASLPRAGFWIRMAALLIDVIVIGVAFTVLEPENIFLLVLAIYGAVMWKLKGTTVGGIVCNLKVVRLDGREVDWGTAAVRALSCFLSLAPLGLGFMWIGFSSSRQAWHDKIAGTVVVRVPHGVSLV